MSIDAAAPTPRLEVRDLRLMVALGAARTTAAAAKQLHLTQSAVSRALGVAEQHAGVPLFDRTPRGLVPTAAGCKLLEAAPDMLAQLAALERRVREPVAEPARVRLVSECYMAYPWLAQMTLALRRSAPELVVEMPTRHTASAAEGLLAGEVDIAMLASAVPPGLPSLDLFEDELMFIVSADHPVARRGGLRPDDLLEHRLLIPTATAADRWFLSRVFGARRVRLKFDRFPVTEALVEFARAGIGIAVISEWVAGSYLASPMSGLRAMRLESGPLNRSWKLAYRKEHERWVEPFRDAMHAARPRRPPRS